MRGAWPLALLLICCSSTTPRANECSCSHWADSLERWAVTELNKNGLRERTGLTVDLLVPDCMAIRTTRLGAGSEHVTVEVNISFRDEAHAAGNISLRRIGGGRQGVALHNFERRNCSVEDTGVVGWED